MPKSFKWLHFSDLHFNVNSNFDVARVRKELINLLKGDFFKCDYVFITGDIANKFDYTNIDKFINDLLEAIGIKDYQKKEKVFWAPGNHDINQKRRLRNQIIQEIRDSKNNESQMFQNLMQQDEERILLTRVGMSEYFEQYKKLFNREFTDEEINRGYLFFNLPDINLIVLNTCITSYDKNDEKNLLIIEPTLNDISEKIDSGKLTFVLAHHGKEFLNIQEIDEVAVLLDDSKVDFYLCGHSHKLGCSMFGGTKQDVHQITCGGGQANDGYSKLTFVVGEYCAEKNEIHITPYSYSTSNRRWNEDYTLDPKLHDHNIFKPNININLNQNNSSNVEVKQYIEKCFIKSETYYNELLQENGRLAYIKEIFDESLFPPIEPKGKCDVRFNTIKNNTMIDCVLNLNKNCIFLGEGGTAKTMASLKIWQYYLSEKNKLPIYVPLIECHDKFHSSISINEYIEKNYNIDINNNYIPIVLLLDGLSDISLNFDSHIKDIIKISKLTHVTVVMTSKYEISQLKELSDFYTYNILPLPEKVYALYLKENNLTKYDVPNNILDNPVMLSSYTKHKKLEQLHRLNSKNLIENTLMTACNLLMYHHNDLFIRSVIVKCDYDKKIRTTIYSHNARPDPEKTASIDLSFGVIGECLEMRNIIYRILPEDHINQYPDNIKPLITPELRGVIAAPIFKSKQIIAVLAIDILDYNGYNKSKYDFPNRSILDNVQVWADSLSYLLDI